MIEVLLVIFSKQGVIVALGKSIIPLFSHISGAKWSCKSI